VQRLSIFWGNLLVGTLCRHTRGRVRFQYAPDWVSDIGRPISLSLPCQKEMFPQGVSTAFFENLLPESDVRSVLAFNNRFNKKDTFSFLEHFGQDCTGALSIIPEDQLLDTTPWRYENVTEDLIRALDIIEKHPGERQLYSEMQPTRLSIAGAQDKLPVFFTGNKFYLPTNSGSATTHIIKPVSPRFPGIQRNEAFCMDLARNIGLRVPNTFLFQIDHHDLYVVERFDRQILPERVARIHQEDFCQAFGISADRKYQLKGGPGFDQCRSLIDEHLSYQSLDIRSEWVAVLAFNFIVGNHDAHAKNFSIMHGRGIYMAPYYDLLSTMIYDHLEPHFAMSIGETFRHDRISAKSFTEFAKDMKFRPVKVAEIIDTTIQLVDREVPGLLSEHEQKYGPAFIYSRLDRVLSGNLKRLAEIRDEIFDRPDVDMTGPGSGQPPGGLPPDRGELGTR
jgi:serine/threonine-protein kinase HipA